MGTINSLQYLIWLKSKAVKIYLVVQSVKLLLALSIYCNTSCSQTDHLKYKKKFRRKSIDFCKSVSQLFSIRNTMNVSLELT